MVTNICATHKKKSLKFQSLTLSSYAKAILYAKPNSLKHSKNVDVSLANGLACQKHHNYTARHYIARVVCIHTVNDHPLNALVNIVRVCCYAAD